ncbi:uncharacterized protein M421DRAFT_283532 [Didymella exigua CBS 183.55]|uniref:Uncharacterized protein n=1 Tax=Didymella exigua CBS 183.55 TaxID=1150837 RepID=A0A6A5RUB6_9PLEO|nr:uncharacterized protein M421DRAFT_283532 [Didymella exigua CBS 183.55]KAF1932055.1 hypothetical protein M421DRAFT_283532 [Didymella exigua CBS 183.55]
MVDSGATSVFRRRHVLPSKFTNIVVGVGRRTHLVSSVLIMGGSERAKQFRNYPPEIAMMECHSGQLSIEQSELPIITEPCRPPLSAVQPASYVPTASVPRPESQQFHL